MKKAKALQYAKYCRIFVDNLYPFREYFIPISCLYLIIYLLTLPFLLFVLKIPPLIIVVHATMRMLTISGIYVFVLTVEPLVYKIWDKILIFADNNPSNNCK